MKQKAEELKKVYEGLNEDARKHMSKLDEFLVRNSMNQEQVQLLFENALKAADQKYPELEKMEGMSSREYAELYRKMGEEIITYPEKFEESARESGMSPEDLAILFQQINGSVVRYPEVWESREAAQMLSPKNLSILIDAFRKEK